MARMQEKNGIKLGDWVTSCRADCTCHTGPTGWTCPTCQRGNIVVGFTAKSVLVQPIQFHGWRGMKAMIRLEDVHVIGRVEELL